MIKFVLSSEIYLAKYYYLKNIVLTNNYLTRFSFEKIFDEKTSDFVDNPYYDSNFSTFATICNQDALVGDVDLNDADKIHYYNVGIKKLQSLKTSIDNLEIAIKEIKNKNDKNGEYQKFVDEMAVQIESYQNYLTNNIMI